MRRVYIGEKVGKLKAFKVSLVTCLNMLFALLLSMFFSRQYSVRSRLCYSVASVVYLSVCLWNVLWLNGES